MSTLDEYKSILINADTLDLAYLTAETTDFSVKNGGELVALIGVDTGGNIVLDMRFDTETDDTGFGFHGVRKSDIKGLPKASELINEFHLFFNALRNCDVSCWSEWFTRFFGEWLDRDIPVSAIKYHLHKMWFYHPSLHALSASDLYYCAERLGIDNQWDNLYEKAMIGYQVWKKSEQILEVFHRYIDAQKQAHERYNQLLSLANADMYDDEDISF